MVDSSRPETNKRNCTNYFSALEQLPKPEWLIEGELNDLHWTILTDNPAKKRNAAEHIRFDTPICEGPVLLSDRALRHDLLTAKLFVYYSLSRVDGWKSSALSAAQEYNSLINFFRWKWNQGLRYNSDLTHEWLKEFIRTLREEGLEGLIQSEIRVTKTLESLKKSPARIPLIRKCGNDVIQLAKVLKWLALITGYNCPSPRETLFKNFAMIEGFEIIDWV